MAAHLRAISRSPALLHLDYHPRNVLANLHSITAVIDWANVGVGDPRADLARTYTLLAVEPWQADVPPAVLAAFRRELVAGWWVGYAEVAALPSEAELAPFYAWAGALMLVELGHRVADPAELTPVRAWAAGWRARASHLEHLRPFLFTAAGWEVTASSGWLGHAPCWLRPVVRT